MMQPRHLISIIVTLGCLIGFTPTAHATRPDAPSYAQRGPFTVGTREFRIEDKTRPLNVAVWYPAANPEKKKEQAVYRFLALSTSGQAINDAPLDTSKGPYPLIIFSHGWGGAKYQSLFLVEHLASWGFVVIAADHPGSVFGSTNGFVQNLALRPDDALRSIKFAESLTAADGALAGAIDIERIAVMGHSFGGYTAAAAGGATLNADDLVQQCQAKPDPDLCGVLDNLPEIASLRGLAAAPQGSWAATTDPRIKAVLLFAPAFHRLFGSAGMASLKAPLMVIVGSTDRSTPPEIDAYPMYEQAGSAQKTQVVLENAGHYVFVDSCIPALIVLNQFDRCSDKVWDMTRAHELINHYTTAFLLATLNGDSAAQAAAETVPDQFIGVNIKRAK